MDYNRRTKPARWVSVVTSLVTHTLAACFGAFLVFLCVVAALHQSFVVPTSYGKMLCTKVPDDFK